MEPALLCLVVGLGLVLFVIRNLTQPQILSAEQIGALLLLALSMVLTMTSFLGYNLKFVQHQGRYLFPALAPIGLFFTLGFREVIAREHEALLFTLLFASLFAISLISLFGFVVPYFE